MKFRRRLEYVSAVQLTQAAVDAHVLDKTPLPEGCYVSSYDAHPPTRVVSRAVVRLRNHNRDLVMPGDWIVRAEDGTLSVCRPDEFDAAYEPDPGSDHPQPASPSHLHRPGPRRG